MTASSGARKHLPIPLDPSFLQLSGQIAIEAVLRSIVRSVRFELLPGDGAFRLLGADLSYHRVDPHLAGALRDLDEHLTAAELGFYRASRQFFDLCCEDSWTGYFIARELRRSERPDPDLVIVHLDDHMDMMSTLLECSGEVLRDPSTGKIFDPSSSEDWASAIESGAVNIGNFLTPLYFMKPKVHVRHLRNAAGAEHRTFDVVRARCSYPQVPNKKFAAISRTSGGSGESAGTYLSGSSAEEVLGSMPDGRVFVHIDLDYFVNDFNGASKGDDYLPAATLMAEAQRKMTDFFSSLSRIPGVDRWIVATSPGFCSGYHWKSLLAQLEEGIRGFEMARGVVRHDPRRPR